MTPPSTPPTYSIKIADFGLARETYSRTPYTTYVSTRWYRAPEVLLRAGEYSAPVDIWAIGAMAVEIATLKPLFPGGNEVDQVWRVCEIMGSPGSWVNKQGQRVGGGEWKDGIKLAQKLGFSFPKMAPHSLETHLPLPHWPSSLAHFVTWCLMWDPKARPTSRQALEHAFFADAVDPLKSTVRTTTPKSLGRKTSSSGIQDTEGGHGLATKTSSWFRKSLVGGISTTAAPEPVASAQTISNRPMPVHANSENIAATQRSRPTANKRATWASGAPSNAAPIPILPSIRPVSPLPDSTTAQASATRQQPENRTSKKIGRQLSVASHGNHYAELHRQEAERALEGGNGLKSPTSSQREGFFSHLRKRARRLSGRNQGIIPADDVEANAGCAPWVAANRQPVQDASSLAPQASDPSVDPKFAELDKALNNVCYSLDVAAASTNPLPRVPSRVSSNPSLKRHHSLPYGIDGRSSPAQPTNAPVASRTRKSLRQSNQRYETPDEEEELLNEAMHSATRAARHLSQEPQARSRNSPQQSHSLNPHATVDQRNNAAYLTPSQSKENNGVSFGAHEYTPVKPMDIPQMRHKKSNVQSQWPTPPYEENDWAAAAAASIFATQAQFR